MSTGTRKYWDKNAGDWDAIYLDESRTARAVNQLFRKAIYERFQTALDAGGDLTGKSVLDVGCGSGRLVVEALLQGANRGVGLDFAPQMLELARASAADAGVAERAEFVLSDFMEYDGSEKFDLVVANGFFDYIADPQNVLRRLALLARGRVVASFPGRSLFRNLFRRIRYGLQGCPVFFYSEAQIRELADQCGFVEYDIRYMRHSGTGFMLVAKVRS